MSLLESSFGLSRVKKSAMHSVTLCSLLLRTALLCSVLLCSVLLCTICGCGNEEEVVPVQGKVTYGATPVAEGTITFEESTRKATVQSTLSPEGKYSLRVAPGNYKITVEPPMVAETRGSDAGQTYKKVNNIPANVRIAESTPLNATVDAAATLDFELKK